MKYSRVFSSAAAVVVVAGSCAWGMPHSGSPADAKPPVVTVDAANTAKAATETSCTDIIEVTHGGGAPGRKANVKLCAHTNGQAVRVTFGADCFSGGGATRYPDCLPNGYWQLYKGEMLVASGGASVSVLYPGPGTYTLTASVRVHAINPGSSQFAVDGEISQNITLTTPIPPGPRLNGGTNTAGGTRTVTVTNVGNQPATGVEIEIRAKGDAWKQILVSKIAITDDARCSNKSILAQCQLGSLAPDASVSVALASGTSPLCHSGTTSTFTYSYTAAGLDPMGGAGPC